MADIRINALATTASSTASDDFLAVDGSANGTRKLNAYSPSFGGNATVGGTLGLNGAASGAVLNVKETAGVPTAFNLTNRNSTQTWSLAVDAASVDDKLLAFISGGTVVASLNPTTNAATLAGNLTVSGTTGVTVSAANATFFQSSSQSGFGPASGLISGGSGVNTAISYYVTSALVFGITSGAEVARFAASTGNLLLGTTTDSANGKLQLATHTTSAGGIGFGTDTTLFRAAAGNLCLGDSGTNAALSLYNAGTQRAYLFAQGSSSTFFIGSLTAGWSTAIQSGNGTTALTLDSSQNATFAGTVSVAKGAPQVKVSLDRNSSTDSAYVQYKTNGTQNWVLGTGVTGSDTNYSFYSYGGGGTALSLNYTTGDATFAGKIAINNTVNTVSPTSPNRTITMVIGGTTYYIAAKTTND